MLSVYASGRVIGMDVVMILAQKMEWGVDVVDGEESGDQEGAQEAVL